MVLLGQYSASPPPFPFSHRVMESSLFFSLWAPASSPKDGHRASERTRNFFIEIRSNKTLRHTQPGHQNQQTKPPPRSPKNTCTVPKTPCRALESPALANPDTVATRSYTDMLPTLTVTEVIYLPQPLGAERVS